MMGHREKLKGSNEWDALTKARHLYGRRAGVTKYYKRKFNKRQRRNALQEEMVAAK
jgi:hypothetical protein